MSIRQRCTLAMLSIHPSVAWGLMAAMAGGWVAAFYQLIRIAYSATLSPATANALPPLIIGLTPVTIVLFLAALMVVTTHEAKDAGLERLMEETSAR